MSVIAARDNCPRDKREVVARVLLDLDDRARSDGRQKQRFTNADPPRTRSPPSTAIRCRHGWPTPARARRRPPGCGPLTSKGGTDTEPGVVINPGQGTSPLVPSASIIPPTTSSCHSSVLRPGSLPAFPIPLLAPSPARFDQPGPPVTPGTPRTPLAQVSSDLGQLVARSGVGPTPDAAAAASNTATSTAGSILVWTRPRPVRAVGQRLQPAVLVPRQPRVQRLTGHLPRRRDLHSPCGHHRSPREPPCTAAQPRSSPSSRERQGSTEATVNHQPKHRQASTEDQTSSIRRSHTQAESWRRDSNPQPPVYKVSRLASQNALTCGNVPIDGLMRGRCATCVRYRRPHLATCVVRHPHDRSAFMTHGRCPLGGRSRGR